MNMKQMIASAVAYTVLSEQYSEEQIEALSEQSRQQLARVEGSQFPEEVKAALRARVFGDFETAEKIRAAVPHLFTNVVLEPLRQTIPNLSQPTLELVQSTTIALRAGKAVH